MMLAPILAVARGAATSCVDAPAPLLWLFNGSHPGKSRGVAAHFDMSLQPGGVHTNAYPVHPLSALPGLPTCARGLLGVPGGLESRPPSAERTSRRGGDAAAPHARIG